jgi:hypothetical protein
LNEVKLLRDQIKTTYQGDSWHGPSVLKTLDGVDLKQAKSRPMPDRHTIWELVDHTAFWLEVSTEAAKGNYQEPDLEGNWPKMGETEDDWNRSLNRLEIAINSLQNALAPLTNNDMKKIIPCTDYNLRQMLHGALHHNLYHAGQIAILKDKLEK